MDRLLLGKLGIFALFAATFGTVVFSTYRFAFSPTWRMDPIPFAFFVALSGGVGWLLGRRRPPPCPRHT